MRDQLRAGLRTTGRLAAIEVTLLGAGTLIGWALGTSITAATDVVRDASARIRARHVGDRPATRR